MESIYSALQPVTSSMFSRFGYHEESWQLLFEFKSTKEIRAYQNVSPEVADEAKFAESLGKFFNSQIKGNSAWTFETLGADPSVLPPAPKKAEVECGLSEEELDFIAPVAETLLTKTTLTDGSNSMERMSPEYAAAKYPTTKVVMEDSDWPEGEKDYVEKELDRLAQTALTTQPVGEVMGAWTEPVTAVDALSLLQEREGEIKAIIAQCKNDSDKALSIKVTTPQTRLQASDVLTILTDRKDTTLALLDPFRKILYDSYTYANDLKKSAIDPLENAVKSVKAQILTWDREMERQRQEAVRKAREEAEAESRRLQEEEAARIKLADVSDALEDGDTEKAQTLFDAPVVVPHIYVQPTYIAPSAPVIEGQSSRSNWKVVEDEISMIDFLRAVKNDKFPLESAAQLLSPNLTELNRLAKALKTAFNVPGMRAEDQGSISVRRKK